MGYVYRIPANTGRNATGIKGLEVPVEEAQPRPSQLKAQDAATLAYIIKLSDLQRELAAVKARLAEETERHSETKHDLLMEGSNRLQAQQRVIQLEELLEGSRKERDHMRCELIEYEAGMRGKPILEEENRLLREQLSAREQRVAELEETIQSICSMSQPEAMEVRAE